MAKAIKQSIEQFIEKSEEVLERITQLKEYLCNAQIREAITAQQARLQRMLFIAVVGEVKAGKSTFINHLLKTEVCKTDFDVCTHQIEQITYAEDESEFNTDNLRKVAKNIPLLKGVAILDTPGINVINDEHERIAKSIIPEVDIVFFILHRMHINQQTTWEFVDFIQKEWQRRVFFVLTHCDEFPSLDKQQQHINIIHAQAVSHGIEEPVIFTTSAGNEDREESGFTEIRAHLEKDFDESGSYHTKKQSIIDAFQMIIDVIDKVYEKRRELLDDYLDSLQQTEDQAQELFLHMPEIARDNRDYFPISTIDRKQQVISGLLDLVGQGGTLIHKLDVIDEKMERCHEIMIDLKVKDVKQKFIDRLNSTEKEIHHQVEILFHFNPLSGKVSSEQVMGFFSSTPKKLLSSFMKIIKPYPIKVKLAFIGGAVLIIMLLLSQMVDFFLSMILQLVLLSPILFIIISAGLWRYRKIRLRDFDNRLKSMHLDLQTLYEDLRKHVRKQYNLQEKDLGKMKKLFAALK